MAPSGPDASNACLPANSPVILSVPPVPSPMRGERCSLDGEGGRASADKPLLMYTSNKFVVVRNITQDPDDNKLPPLVPNSLSKLPVLVYRGHRDNTTTAQLSPSGCYCVSGDDKGIIRVWAFDHDDHLTKYNVQALSGPIRDVAWDGENKRIALCGERAGSDAQGDCAKALQWDTGVTVGALGNHLKGRAASIAFKPQRPFRIVTGGKDDFKTNFHKGPPFQRIPTENSVPMDTAHTKGAVNCIRYNHAGTLAVSVGTDRSICLYDGTTWELKSRVEAIHTATVYACAWNKDDTHVLTCSGDGTVKLFKVDGISLKEEHVWKPAEVQFGKAFEKVPVGGVQLGCAFVQGNIPVSVGFNGQLSILPMPGSSSSKIKVMTGHYAPIAAMTVDWDNGKFYTGDTDGIICKWDLEKVQPETRLCHPEGNNDLMYVVHSGAISGLAVAKGYLMSVGWDDKMYIADQAGKVKMEPTLLGAQPSMIARGTNVAVIITVQGLLLAKNNGEISNMFKIDYEAGAACVDQNDGVVYVGGKSDNAIHVYDVIKTPSEWTLKEKHVITDGHLKPIHAMAISNDGSKLASADERDVCVFDLNSAPDYAPIIARGRWCFHVQRVTSLSWAPDNKVIASGGADDSIFLWNIDHKMKRIHYPFAHRGGIVDVTFYKSKSKGLLLLSTGVDSVVNLWDVTSDVRDKFK